MQQVPSYGSNSSNRPINLNKFAFEAYLLRLPRNVKRNIVNLGCCNDKLEIETGRYSDIDRDLRYCGKCAVIIIGDEPVSFHYI